MSTHPEPIESAQVHQAENERKSVGFHQKFIEIITGPDPRFDSIDLELDEEIIVDPYECHAPSRRSDSDLAALLNLLDSLETGIDRKETTR